MKTKGGGATPMKEPNQNGGWDIFGKNTQSFKIALDLYMGIPYYGMVYLVSSQCEGHLSFVNAPE